MSGPDTHELLETAAEQTLLGDGVELREADEPGAFVAGDRLGRYAILEQVGAGGMGLVYAAYDPQLDRKVALKVLHRRLAAKAGTKATGHLLREARAMARLSHPNVVAVHDLGDMDGRVFVAMEFIEGPTLRAWLETEERSWQEIVGAFTQAGEGLAGAHASGMIHRDFKPENVMIDARGRSRVLDFGLAREDDAVAHQNQGQGATHEHAAVDASLRSLRTDIDLTATRGMAGTPAYMSPEQHLGESLDARSDQFSFCVALWEALFGERPYAGDTVSVLAFQVTQGEMRAAPRDTPIPARISAALVRGLQADPAKRWPSLNELLVSLRVQPPVSAARNLGLVAVAATALGVGAWALGGPGTSEVCNADAQLAVSPWDAGAKAGARTAFEASGHPAHADAFAKVDRELDRRGETWKAGWTDTCEAHNIRKDQGERVYEQRNACLLRRRLETRAFVSLLRDADAELVSRSARAVLELPSIERCSDLAFVAARVEPPSTPALAAQVSAAQAVLARAEVFELTGKYDEGVALLQTLDGEGKGHAAAGFKNYPPAAAEFKTLQGVLLSRQGSDKAAELALREGFLLARRADQGNDAVRAAAELVMIVGDRQQRFSEAELWAELGHIEAEHSVGESQYLPTLVSNEGSLASEQGNLDAAIERYERAIEIWEAASGEADVNIAGAKMNIGTALWNQGKYESADATMREATQSLRKHLGPGHPDVAASLNNLCSLQYGQGRVEDAQASCDAANEIAKASLDPNHPVREAVLTNIANLQYSQGEYDQALKTYEHLLKIVGTRAGEPGGATAGLLSNIGNVYKEQGKIDDAVKNYARAIELSTVAYGIDHPKTGFPLQGMGSVLIEGGQYAEAQRVLLQAVTAWERGGESHPLLGYPLTSLGLNALRSGQALRAVPYLERALKIRTGPEGEAIMAAETQGYLAQALAQRDIGRARELAGAALAAYEAEGTPEEIAEARALVTELAR